MKIQEVNGKHSCDSCYDTRAVQDIMLNPHETTRLRICSLCMARLNSLTFKHFHHERKLVNEKMIEEIPYYNYKYKIYKDQRGLQILANHLYSNKQHQFSDTVIKKLTDLYLKYSIREYNRNLEFQIRQHILVADLSEKNKKSVVEYVVDNFVSIDKLHETIAAAINYLERKVDFVTLDTIDDIWAKLNMGYEIVFKDIQDMLDFVIQESNLSIAKDKSKSDLENEVGK